MQRRQTRRRVLLTILALIVVGLSLGALYFTTIGREHFWLRAPTYVPEAELTDHAPIMTMREYSAIIATHERPYVRRYESETGSLTVYGVSQHTSDPDHPEIAEIRTLWEATAPTVGLTEGRIGVAVGGAHSGVRRFGESGMVYYLAKREGTPVYTLDLPLQDEARRAAREFSPEHVALFYVLRPYFGARRGGPIDNPEAYVREYVRERGDIAGADGAITSIEALDQLWQRDFPNDPDWRDCDDQQTRPEALKEIAAHTNIIRNEHWVDVIAELVGRGETVFAVMGCSHAARLDAVFESVVGPARR